MSVVKIDYKQIVDLGMKVLNFMSWGKIGKTVVIAMLFIAGYSVWENRQPIYKGIISYNAQRLMVQAPLSDATLKAVDELISKPSKIVAVQLVSVDFRTNSRQTELFKSIIPAMQKVIDDYAANKIGNTPFFTDDVKNNARNTSLINGEFSCFRVDELAIFQRVPTLGGFATTVCSISIPPYPGFFSGYVNVYLSDFPDTGEMVDIRAAIRKLSLVTFDSEFPK